MPMRLCFWQEEDDAILKKMTEDGDTLEEIGKVLNRTKRAVSDRRRLLNKNPSQPAVCVPSNKWTQEEDDALLKLYAERRTYGDIAIVLGRTRKAVESRRKLLAHKDRVRAGMREPRRHYCSKIKKEAPTPTWITKVLDNYIAVKEAFLKAKNDIEYHRTELEIAHEEVVEVLRKHYSMVKHRGCQWRLLGKDDFQVIKVRHYTHAG